MVASSSISASGPSTLLGLIMGALLLSELSAFMPLSGMRPHTLQTVSSENMLRRQHRSAITMAAKEGLTFAKYQGLGNDFILVDNRHTSEPVLTPEQSSKLCNRNFGVGGDGVIFALPGKDGTDYTMRIYNSDGSEPEMCGNGIRCMAKFLSQLEGGDSAVSKTYRIWTLAGEIVPAVRSDGLVTVDMGPPILEGSKVPTTLPPSSSGRVVKVPLEVAGKKWEVTCVSMGNPHAVVFVDDLSKLDLNTIGPVFEKHPVFPKKTNTEFVQVMSPTHLKMVVWERGAGPTLACGTGACALTVAANLAGKTSSRTCRVTLPGGDLEIEWREADNKVYMTGPADLVFEGKLSA